MPKSKNDSGVRQLKNGFWAYRFSISVGGRAINQRGSTDLDGNILRTKQDAIKARKKAIKMAQLAPLLPEKKPEPIKRTVRDVFKECKPDVVLVHGDTTTSTAAALAAFYQQIPVGHVEAGLRTHNIYSPWPEEMNRQITGRIATYNFSPTPLSEKNLKEEKAHGRIFVTGNTVIDALHMVVNKLKVDKTLADLQIILSILMDALCILSHIELVAKFTLGTVGHERRITGEIEGKHPSFFSLLLCCLSCSLDRGLRQSVKLGFISDMKGKGLILFQQVL